MPDTLKRIVGPVNVSSGLSTIFAGTSGVTYTFRHMTIVNTTSSAITIRMGIQATAGTLNNNELILPTSTIDAGGLAEWSGILVLTGTQVLRAHASLSGLTFTASGLEQS